MLNFSEYIKNSETNNSNENQKVKYTNEQLEEMINKYSEFSEDKLMSEFIKLTVEKKKKGELTDNDLATLKQTIMPLLNREQQMNLDKILELVKNV